MGHESQRKKIPFRILGTGSGKIKRRGTGKRGVKKIGRTKALLPRKLRVKGIRRSRIPERKIGGKKKTAKGTRIMKKVVL